MATAAPLSPPNEATPRPFSAPHSHPTGMRRWKLTVWDRAYARELLLPISIGLMVMILVMAGNFVYWAINSIVNKGLSLELMLKLFVLAAPGFAVQGIPVGVILAVCLVMNRAVRDNEIIALRVGGTSIPRILVPFLTVALMASFVNWYIVEKVAPVTNDMAEKTVMRLMSISRAPLIDSDKYFRVGNYYFYVQSAEKKVLKNVMVYERGSATFGDLAPTTFPIVYIAEQAFEDPKVQNRWILDNVVTHVYEANGRQKSESRVRQVAINVERELSTYWDEQKSPFSMTSDELSSQIADLETAAFSPEELQKKRVDYYRRFALPFASFVMALMAAPLALRFARHGSFAGLVCAFVLAFFWQGLDSWFRAMGLGSRLEPMVAAWATNCVFFLAGLVLLWRER